MIPLAVGRIKASRRRRATYRVSAHVHLVTLLCLDGSASSRTNGGRSCFNAALDLSSLSKVVPTFVWRFRVMTGIEWGTVEPCVECHRMLA